MQSSLDEQQRLLGHTDEIDAYVEPSTAAEVYRPNIPIILGALWTAVFLGALDGTVVATLLSAIGSDFERAHQASYIGTAYLLSVCCFTPLYGRLSDIIGRKGAMILAQTLFASGTLLCGLAPSMTTLIIARAIAGMGGGGYVISVFRVMTVSSITATDLIPLKQRGLYQGWANITFGLGAGLGGPIGGFINDHFGWRWAFYVQIPFLLTSIIVTIKFLNVELPEKKQTAREKFCRIDWLGSLTLVLAVGGFVLAVMIQATENTQLKNSSIWGLYLCSGVCVIGFVLVEAFVAKEPIMPLRLLTQRTPAAVAANNFLISVNAFSMLYNYPLFFTAVRLTSSQDAGLHLLPNAVAVGLGSVSAGLYMRSTGKFYYCTLGCILLSILSSLLLVTWSRETSRLRLWMDVMPSGFGSAANTTTTLIALIASVDREDIAVATGISYLFRTTGQVVGVAASGAILQSILLRQLRRRITGLGAADTIAQIRHSTTIIPSFDPSTREAAVASYAAGLKAVFIFQAGIALLALLVSLLIKENPLPGSPEEEAEQDAKRRLRQGASSGTTSG